MAVKHEIKSQLAKLLATEDLIVENRNIETAQFDVHTRVLTLPNWEKASNNVYDALVAHEVGHALYTPDVEWFKEMKIPPSFVNIVEDVRIEKLMKRRYAGIAKTFRKGYNELNDEDFFDIDGKDLTDFNLADRINLYFKIGAWNDISFSDVETPIVSLIQNAETFDDTLSAAEALYNFCKEEIENKQKEEIDTDSGMDLEGGGNMPDDNGDDSDFTVLESPSNASMESGSGGDVDNTSMDAGGSFVDLDITEPEIETVDALENALKNLTKMDGGENKYLELPDININDIIISNEFIHNSCNTTWNEHLKKIEEFNPNSNSDKETGFYSYVSGPYKNFDQVDSDYIKFKRNANKEVNYLVKEFECKKAASSYSRSSTARTGVLDTAKLHTYKFNDDLFKKITVVPDGKNHGLVFLLDWSGSMQYVIQDTLKQLYNLLWFCKKVSIPFEVYAFTNCFPKGLIRDFDGVEEDKSYPYIPKSGLVEISNNFSLMNFFTSKVNSKTLDQQMKNIFRIAYTFQCRSIYPIPLGMNLSGTPLNEALVCLHKIIPSFRKKNQLEKVQCIVLTDGEAHPLNYHREVNRPWEDEPYLGVNGIGYNCYLRDRKLGTTYKIDSTYYQFTNVLIENLKDRFNNTSFIGIRILSPRDASSFVRRYCKSYEKCDIIIRHWKKNKSLSIKESGYHTYFGICSNSLDNDVEFEVNEDATKTEIKRAFVKSLKTKKFNKKILSEFVELVV